MSLSVVILAAGQGTRMRSKLPKVLHALAGKPLVQHVIDTAKTLDPQRVHLVYGHGGEQVKATIADPALTWVLQAEQLGTGHAVQQAMPGIPDADKVLILYGDVPLLNAATLKELVELQDGGNISLLTVELADPTGYGRIVRDGAKRVTGIVEHKDATETERHIREVNTGILCARAADLNRWLAALKSDNAQGEFYLTDIIGMCHAEGGQIHTRHPVSAMEVEGVNNRLQLATLERAYQKAQAERLMLAGVTLRDPARFDLRGEFVHGQDVEIDVNVILEGTVRVGHNVRIGANVVLKNVTLGDGVEIKANTVIEDAILGDGCDIGPFARIRPGSVLAGSVHIGNFVELKKANLGEGTKAGHLAYIGDAEVGARVNISAGVITCNYDGANKHVTRIGDDAFIGTDSQLVAPVSIGDGAYIAAGSTITKEAPAGALTICRAREQRSIPGWLKPVKKK